MLSTLFVKLANSLQIYIIYPVFQVFTIVLISPALDFCPTSRKKQQIRSDEAKQHKRNNRLYDNQRE